MYCQLCKAFRRSSNFPLDMCRPHMAQQQVFRHLIALVSPRFSPALDHSALVKLIRRRGGRLFHAEHRPHERFQHLTASVRQSAVAIQEMPTASRRPGICRS